MNFLLIFYHMLSNKSSKLQSLFFLCLGLIYTWDSLNHSSVPTCYIKLQGLFTTRMTRDACSHPPQQGTGGILVQRSNCHHHRHHHRSHHHKHELWTLKPTEQRTLIQPGATEANELLSIELLIELLGIGSVFLKDCSLLLIRELQFSLE